MVRSAAPSESTARVVTIDRSSPVPLYFQVAQSLEKAIAEGEIPAGSRLDNEVHLAAELGVSRPTMRRAMQYLVDKGVLVRRRGVGTRVVQPKVRRGLELTSLYDDLAASGQRPRTDVLSLSIEKPTRLVAEALGCSEDDDVTALVRLRYAGDRPIARMVNYLPHVHPGIRDGVTAEALGERGLYQILRSLGINLHAADQSIGARPATTEEARLLGESKGAALLTMQRIAIDDHGRTVEYANHIYAASRYSFAFSLLAG